MLLQVLDATLTQFGTLIFCLDGLGSLEFIHTQEQSRYLQKAERAHETEIQVRIAVHSISILVVTSVYLYVTNDLLDSSTAMISRLID